MPKGVSDLAVGDSYGFIAPLAAKSSSGVLGYQCFDSAATRYQENVFSQHPGSELPKKEYGKQDYLNISVDEPEEVKEVRLVGGKFIQGISMREVSRSLVSLQDKLKELFEKWGLTRLVVSLEIEEGALKAIKVNTYQGREYREDSLKKALDALSFPSSLTGSIELDLLYL